MQRFIISSILIASLLTAACSSSKQGGEGEADTVRSAKIGFQGDSVARNRRVRPEIGPRSCRVVATIVSIDPTPHSNDPNHPAAKYPSVATIRVDSVLMKGVAFSEQFAPGATATVTFAPTLVSSKEIQPGIQQNLPGLHVGSRFQADVMERRLIPEKSERDFATTPLVVFDYKAL